MNTLSSLYLGSEPTQVKVEDDQLQVTLADGNIIVIPLQLMGQLGQGVPLPAEAQVLVLRQPPQIDHVHVTGGKRKLTTALVTIPTVASQDASGR